MNEHLAVLLDFVRIKHDDFNIEKHSRRLAEILSQSNFIHFDYNVYNQVSMSDISYYANSFYHTCNNLKSILQFAKRPIMFNTPTDISVLTLEKGNNLEFYSIGFDLKDHIEHVLFELRNIIISPYNRENGFPDNLYINQKEYTEIIGVNNKYTITTTNNPNNEQKEYNFNSINWQLWKLNFVLNIKNIEKGIIAKISDGEFNLIQPIQYGQQRPKN